MSSEEKSEAIPHARSGEGKGADARPTSRTTSDYLTRRAVLALLSDDEVASVRTVEDAPRMHDGDEFIDLIHLSQGVRRAGTRPVPMGEVLPRGAVRAATWTAIVKQLAPSAA